MSKRYIYQDSDTGITSEKVELTNEDNLVVGTLKTSPGQGQEPKDVKEIFVQSVSINNEVASEPLDENGNANLEIDEINVDTIDIDNLRIMGKTLGDFIPNMEGLKTFPEIPEDGSPDLEQIVSRVNLLIRYLKAIAEAQSSLDDEESTEGN